MERQHIEPTTALASCVSANANQIWYIDDMNGLDPGLRRRLDLLRDSGQVDPDIAEFLESALPELAARVGVPATEETLATLTSHVALALQRIRRGEALREWKGAGADELADSPELLQAAGDFTERASAVAGGEVPQQELVFIAMHLGAARLKA
jgi:transcriptional antiterminator